MPTIRLLSKQLANQIAAGEVVERPASVVKELLENAVDAGGDRIFCEVRGAGKILIRVRDNGCGIKSDELPLALAPHATSKIVTAEDLNAIHTLGFRGEALASIASVSKLTLTSKTADEDNAFAVRVEGKEQSPIVTPAAHPQGTTVDVSELFFNTPARRRFLKSDRTEMMRIKDIFTRIALAHPKLGFELVADYKNVLRVGPSNVENGIDLKRTSILLGSEFGCDGISVNTDDPHLKISGMLLKPPREEEAVSEQIYLFLNGRPVADKVVTHALKEGFFEVLGKTLPIRCVLYLEIDPKEVDVNVHPRKDEVRFHETSLVHDLITDSIVSALRRAGINATSCDLFANESSFATESPKPVTPDINYQNLPAFPEGKSFFAGAGADRGGDAPKASFGNFSSSSSNTFAGQSGGRYQPPAVGSSSSQHAINLFNRTVQSENTSLNIDVSKVSDSTSFSQTDANQIALVDEVADDTALIKHEGSYYLLNVKALRQYLSGFDYSKQVEEDSVETTKLTMPFSLLVENDLLKSLKNSEEALTRCGFKLNLGRKKIELCVIPKILLGANLADFSVRAFLIITAAASSIVKGQCPLSLSTLIGSYVRSQDAFTSLQLIHKISSFDDIKDQGLLVSKIDFQAMTRTWRNGE
ncbi:MAG: DNA mismatch repair endonuclease MutL [Succinivibrio sp.]